MAFTLQVIRGATTYNISAGQPIALEDLDDVGGASVRVLEERGPFQDGASHLDYRLEPRVMTLRLNVVGSSASALDGHRDTLNAMFKPVRGVPILLRFTRDDGEIRQIDCQRVGPLNIPLHKLERPGNLHRAVVQLRAADPLFYDPTELEEDLIEPSSEWWLGHNSIGSANVLEHVETPTQGQLWANTGSVATGSAFSIAFRSERPTANDYAFSVYVPGYGVFDSLLFRTVQATVTYQAAQFGSATSTTDQFMPVSGTSNYFMVYDATYGYLYRDNVQVWSGSVTTPHGILPASSGTARWRSQYTGTANAPWGTPLLRAAVYNVALNSTQRAALNDHMARTSGSAYSVEIVYDGDYDSYPVITLNGPLADPVITNTITGDRLDFTGGTIGSTDIWTIDLRYGRKSVLSGTASIVSYLSDDSDLATFRLLPDPVATGGTNTITVSFTSNGTASAISLAYVNRYLSF